MPFSSSPDPSPDSQSPGPSAPERLIQRLAAVTLGGVSLLVLGLIFMPTHAGWSQAVPATLSLPSIVAEEASDNLDSRAPSSAVSLTDRASHPSETLAPYFAPSAPASASHAPEVLHQFHELLGQYVQRQAEDDNFTIRVLDGRTNEVLERYELDSLRDAYRQGHDLDWPEVDKHRREAMDRLVDKYEQRGVPVEDIIVRWGRANQIEEAHDRDRAYRAYELRLAESLGLSQLATEIGTVETFNQDHLVSPADARSRYQMLPWILRRSGVNEYTLPTETDNWIRVREERHPLLVLEPAFLVIRGYVNAVGHELPGLSAYHAGPGNIFKVYRRYYSETGPLASNSTVADAYAWALTEGFDAVSENSSFGSASRGYVPALYGSLKAVDERPMESSTSFRAARLQVKPGASVTVKTLLTALDTTARSLDWGPTAAEGSPYERFRALNPHFDLPPASDDTVPSGGNVRLVSSIDGKAVRFFLPLKSPDVLRAAGITALDSTATFRYDASTYSGPSPDQVTRWDRQYDRLVDDIEEFGFTEQHRERLLDLHERFESLAEENPTRYRRRQLQIISTHRRLWLSNPWEELAEATKMATGRMRIQPQPLEMLAVPSVDLQESLLPAPQ